MVVRGGSGRIVILDIWSGLSILGDGLLNAGGGESQVELVEKKFS